MDPKLSDHMPAQQDATLPAMFPSNMPSDAPSYAGEGGSMDSPIVPIENESTSQSANWEMVEDKGTAWELEDKKTGSEWEVTPRIED